jgi:hypothetical protein
VAWRVDFGLGLPIYDPLSSVTVANYHTVSLQQDRTRLDTYSTSTPHRETGDFVEPFVANTGTFCKMGDTGSSVRLPRRLVTATSTASSLKCN